MEKEYIKYVGVLSSSLLAASAAYLIDLNQPATAAALLLVPVSYGYTAFISSESFQKASLAPLVCLAFMGFDPIVSAVAIAVAVGSPAISFFSSGSGFKDFFGCVALPMLLVGLVLGGFAYHQASSSPEIRERMERGAATAIESQASLLLGRMEGGGESASAAVRATEGIVAEEMRGNLSRAQMERLEASFDSAERQISEQASGSGADEARQQGLRAASDQAASALVTKRNLKALIPASGLFMYSLSPLIGLLTASAAAGFREVTART